MSALATILITIDDPPTVEIKWLRIPTPAETIKGVDLARKLAADLHSVEPKPPAPLADRILPPIAVEQTDPPTADSLNAAELSTVTLQGQS